MNQEEKFIINDYQKKPTFASFLPGISGEKGIPVWSFYVNRGQGICSFGSESKEHSIMEFYPAVQAYENIRNIGFRTFIKIEGEIYEPFQEEKNTITQMRIGINDLEIREINTEKEIEIRIMYSTLSNEETGALIRKVSIYNLAGREQKIEILDGMPAIIPYGISLKEMKETAQTMKAWMMVEDLESRLPYFKVRTSTKDSTVITKIEAGNFYFTVCEGELWPAIVDPDIVFEYDTSFKTPIGLVNHSLKELFSYNQITNNNLPCSFFGKSIQLEGKKKIDFYGLIGKVKNKTERNELKEKCLKMDFFEKKKVEADNMIENVCKGIHTITGDPVFDAYCKQTFLDNVLRGGYPIKIGKEKVLYIFGRKHGDIERDYNSFQMMAEYYSQGNGNFRDMNQNRRCDVAFFPFVAEKNIKIFYNLIQLDGYNPLLIKQMYFVLDETSFEKLIHDFPDISFELKSGLEKFIKTPFSPGSLLTFLNTNKIQGFDFQDFLFQEILEKASEEQQVEHGEGFWIDHWTYNLDLVENYLTIFPDLEEELLFKDRTYTCYSSIAYVQARKKRYTHTNQGVRQLNAVIEDKEMINGGKIIFSLIEKMILIVVNKYSSLDPYGLGIEMEAGKPGWYDALNGLPALFGSSMSETIELLRLINFILEKIGNFEYNIKVPSCLGIFIEEIYRVAICKDRENQVARLNGWDKINSAKESYREAIHNGISDKIEEIKTERLISILTEWKNDIEVGMEYAIKFGDGICPTYFYANSASTERVFRYQLNIDSDCF